MALTRKFLKSPSLPDEQVESIIEAHSETVDALKTQMEDLRQQAGKRLHKFNKCDTITMQKRR